MRSEDEIRKELEHIEKLYGLLFNKLFEGASFEITDEDKVTQNAAKTSSDIYSDKPDLRQAYLLGLMDGRLQALQWILGERDQLYENW